MKSKFSRILGVVAVIALLASFMAAPVSALSQATVTIDPTDISRVNAEYTIFFTVHEEIDGDDTTTFRLPDLGDVFTILGNAGGADSGTITVTTGSVSAAPAANATVAGGSILVNITPASGAVAWTAPTASDDIVVTDTTGLDTTTGTWTQEARFATTGTAEAVEDSTVDATTFDLPDYDEVSTTGDLFTITDHATIADSGTITVTAGSVTATPAGAATVATGAVAVIITPASGAVAWTTPGAGTGTIVVEANTDGTTGSWTNTAGPVTFPVTEVTEAIVLGTPAADGDTTITITFPQDTVLSAGVPTATISASKGWIGTGYLDATLDSTAWSHNVDDLTLTYTMQGGDEIGASAQVMINITAGITNPTEPGDYILEVETSEEDAVESVTYEIEAPDVDVLPGIVEAYNPAGILMNSATGTDAIATMLAVAEEDWTIKIGEGEYTENPDIDDVGVTIEGSGDVEDIVVVGNWTIDVADITIDGITLDGNLTVSADDFILQNSIVDDGGTLDISNTNATDATVTDTTFNVEDDVGIEVNADDTVITGSTFNIEAGGVGISVEVGGTDTDVSDSTFTGSSGVGINVTDALSVLDVEGSTFDGLDTALDIDAGTVGITGNTIQNSVAEAIIVTAADGVTLVANTITGNDDAVLLFVDENAENVQMIFNTITDNAGDADGLLIDNGDSDPDDLFVVNNWWGDADGPGDDAFSDDVVSEPFLAGPISANSDLATGVAAGTTADFKDTAGVTVVSAGQPMEVVAAAEYTVNPLDAIDDAVGFWDVYVINATADITGLEVRIYTDVTEVTEVWVWGAAKGEWLEASTVTPNLFGGFVLVGIDDSTGTPLVADLEGLPFVVVEPPADAPGAVTITAPEVGAVDVSTTPILAWTVEDDATYEIQIAQDATFAILDEAATSPTNAFIVTTALAEGQSYYWRVRAVTDAGAGDWATGVFSTATPVEPTPPIEVVETGPPEITVTMPAPQVTQAIDPGLLWAIIGVGAVLVISLIVLIVRTRRAA